MIERPPPEEPSAPGLLNGLGYSSSTYRSGPDAAGGAETVYYLGGIAQTAFPTPTSDATYGQINIACRTGWRYIEPDSNSADFNWDSIDKCQEIVQPITGAKWSLSIKAGVDTPLWLYNSSCSAVTPQPSESPAGSGSLTGFKVKYTIDNQYPANSIQCVPIPWATPYLNALSTFIGAVHTHVVGLTGGTSKLDQVVVTGINYNTQENTQPHCNSANCGWDGASTDVSNWQTVIHTLDSVCNATGTPNSTCISDYESHLNTAYNTIIGDWGSTFSSSSVGLASMIVEGASFPFENTNAFSLGLLNEVVNYTTPSRSIVMNNAAQYQVSPTPTPELDPNILCYQGIGTSCPVPAVTSHIAFQELKDGVTNGFASNCGNFTALLNAASGDNSLFMETYPLDISTCLQREATIPSKLWFLSFAKWRNTMSATSMRAPSPKQFPALVQRPFQSRFLRIVVVLPLLMLVLSLYVNRAFGASEQVLYNFIAFSNDGWSPNGGLVADSNGNLYGTTSTGGNSGGEPTGTVFKVTPAGQETILWSFGLAFVQGESPGAGVIMDKNGNLFGTTDSGGLYDNFFSDVGGTVFKLSTDGQESVLWNFGNGTDGLAPGTSLIMDGSGNLFGTTSAGGIYNGGIAFELSPSGEETILWNFGNGTDGAVPSSGLTMDASGNLYGTTNYGGLFVVNPRLGQGGTLFKLTRPAARGAGAATTGSWTESVLWNFGNGADGQNPNSVITDANGNFFGTTGGGGTNNAGTVFEVAAAGQEAVLWNFGSGADGDSPGGLIMDASGNLLGATGGGGVFNGGGTAFELTPPAVPGNPWTETILWNFGNGLDGRGPTSPLLLDASGNLFGTTASGGTSVYGGTVFELSGVSPSGQISLSAQHLQFPTTAVGGSSSYQLAIRNTGKGQLTGSIAAPPAPFALKGSGSFSLAPRTETTVTLTFAPTLDARAHRSDTVSSNSAQQGTLTLDLRGIGISGGTTLALNHR